MGVKVRQKVKGKGKPWWVFISHNGQRASKMVGDKAAAEEVASTIRAQLKLNQFDFEEKQTAHTFKQYADTWIKTTVPATCKDSTAQGYQGLLEKHVLPAFKDLKVNEITEGTVKEFLFGKANAGYSGSSITHMKNTISGVLTQAIDNKMISANPALNLGKNFMKKINDAIEARNISHGNGDEEKADPLSKEDLRLLLDTVQKHFTSDYPLFLLLARTGVRIGEALGLRWGDIDFNGRFINLKRSLSWGKITTLKGKRERQVDMSRQLSHTLRSYLKKCREKGLKLGLGDHPEYVFTNRLGGFLDVNNWRRRVFNKALAKAELRNIRIHDLRHTYATLRISKGDNIADVSNQLGHFSETFTMKVYYHWIPGKKKAEVDALDDLEFHDESRAANE